MRAGQALHEDASPGGKEGCGRIRSMVMFACSRKMLRRGAVSLIWMRDGARLLQRPFYVKIYVHVPASGFWSDGYR